MSLHRSLKTRPTALAHHRNVLKRAERITRLTERDRFKAGEDSPIGLVKVANRVLTAGKKKKAAKEAAAGEKTADTAAAPAADAKGAGKADAKGKAADPKAKAAAKPAGKGAGKGK
jgi:small basic protein (TIGR04137 family)